MLRIAISLLTALSTLAVLTPSASPSTADAVNVAALPAVDGDERWGINHVYGQGASAELARQAGARWNRWEFRWQDIEPTQGWLQYDQADAAVAQSLAQGLSVQGILISAPDWWKDETTQLPSGLYLRWSDPRNFWGRWVKATASHYQGKVRYWEVWNEPDMQEVFWGATVADYYQLLKVAYQAIKSVDSSNQVLLGGLSYWSQTGFLDELLRLMLADPTAAQHNYYFDILSWHTYSRPSDVMDRVTQSRSQLAATVGARPIWVNETNVPAWDESPQNDYKPYPWAATAQEQASYIIQAFAYSIAAGADKLFVYRLQDNEWPEAYGLQRTDGTLRPAYVAYQVAARYLSGASAGAVARQGDVDQIVIRRPGERVLVVWNRTPNRVSTSIGALATSATAIDQAGGQHPIRATAGQYQLDLVPASAHNGTDPTDYHVGGPPLIIVEPSAATGPTVNESSPLLGYGGGWETVNALGPIGGTMRRTATAGLGVAVEFEGASVTWLTSKGPDRGMARIVVDGVTQGDVDLYSTTPVWEVPLTFGDFSAGRHRMVITALGQRSAAASGTFVDVDGFIADGLRAAAPPPTPTSTATPLSTATPPVLLPPTFPPTRGPAGAPAAPPASPIVVPPGPTSIRLPSPFDGAPNVGPDAGSPAGRRAG